nr:pilin [Nitrincola lacisaponensis]
MSEVILAASTCRTTISEHYQTGTTAPTVGGQWGCESANPSTQYVGAVATTQNGAIRVTIQNIGTGIDGGFVYLEPMANDTTALAAASVGQTVVNRWRCGGSNAAVLQALPGSCSHNYSTAPSGTFASN